MLCPSTEIRQIFKSEGKAVCEGAHACRMSTPSQEWGCRYPVQAWEWTVYF